MRIRFPEIDTHVPKASGVYEIHTDEGVPLKVGVAIDLLKRLKSHRASRDSGLRWKKGSDGRIWLRVPERRAIAPTSKMSSTAVTEAKQTTA